jgi:hypothetical protein
MAIMDKFEATFLYMSNARLGYIQGVCEDVDFSGWEWLATARAAYLHLKPNRAFQMPPKEFHAPKNSRR